MSQQNDQAANRTEGIRQLSPPSYKDYMLREIRPLFLRVENCIYKVHAWFLMRDSPVLCALLGFLDSDRSPTREGFSYSYPLHLPSTTTIEFESLLAYYYDRPSPEALSLQTWTHLLSISDQYCFAKIRETAIAALTSLKDGPSGLSPNQILRMALQFKISHWLEPVYEEIVKGADPLSLDDMDGLPFDIVALLTRCRERYHQYANRVLDTDGNTTFKTAANDILREEIAHLGITQ